MNNIINLQNNSLINILSIVNKNKNIFNKHLIKERNIYIYIQRQNGLTYKEIAKYHNITIKRIKKILVNTERKLKLIILKVKDI